MQQLHIWGESLDYIFVLVCQIASHVKILFSFFFLFLPFVCFHRCLCLIQPTGWNSFTMEMQWREVEREEEEVNGTFHFRVFLSSFACVRERLYRPLSLSQADRRCVYCIRAIVSFISSILACKKKREMWIEERDEMIEQLVTTWAISPWKRPNGVCVCVCSKCGGNWSQLVAFPAVKGSNWLIDALIVTDHVGDKRKSPDGRYRRSNPSIPSAAIRFFYFSCVYRHHWRSYQRRGG